MDSNNENSLSISSEENMINSSTDESVAPLRPIKKKEYVKKQKPNKKKNFNNIKVEQSKTVGTELYIIHSKWSLTRIDKFTSQYGRVGTLRIICDGDRETNRNLALLETDVYDKLVAKGYGERENKKGYQISVFNNNALELPRKDCNRNLFIPVPEIFRNDDFKVIEIITEKLEYFVEWDMLPNECWNIEVLYKSREKGEISKGCFVIFDDDLPLTTIARARLLMTGIYWPEHDSAKGKEREKFVSLWALDNRKRKEFRNKVEDKKYVKREDNKERKIYTDEEKKEYKKKRDEENKDKKYVKKEDKKYVKREDKKSVNKDNKENNKDTKVRRKILSEEQPKILIPVVPQPIEISVSEESQEDIVIEEDIKQ